MRGYVKDDCFNWAMKKKEEGLIRHFGFSFHGTPELLDKILSEHPGSRDRTDQMNYADWENPLVQSVDCMKFFANTTCLSWLWSHLGGSLASASPEVEAEMKRSNRTLPASWALRCGISSGVKPQYFPACPTKSR